MKKVMIIGCPGSGKSTFARALHEITDIPLYYLDMMYWNPDRTAVDKEVFKERLSKVLQEESFIIDGNYGSTMEMRLKACDTVFFLDYPTEVCLEAVASRKGKKRPDMPWVEDGDDTEFLEFIQSYNTNSSPKVISLLATYKNVERIIFKSREESDKYLEDLKNQ